VEEDTTAGSTPNEKMPSGKEQPSKPGMAGGRTGEAKSSDAVRETIRFNEMGNDPPLNS